MFASALIAVSSLLRRQHRRTSQRMRPRSRFRTSRIAIWIAWGRESRHSGGRSRM